MGAYGRYTQQTESGRAASCYRPSWPAYFTSQASVARTFVFALWYSNSHSESRTIHSAHNAVIHTVISPKRAYFLSGIACLQSVKRLVSVLRSTYTKTSFEFIVHSGFLFIYRQQRSNFWQTTKSSRRQSYVIINGFFYPFSRLYADNI